MKTGIITQIMIIIIKILDKWKALNNRFTKFYKNKNKYE